MKGFLDFGLPYELGWISSDYIGWVSFASSRLAVYLGLIVLPKNFSPDGDLGGVYPLGEAWLFSLDINMGDGGASRVGPGLWISFMN